MAKSVGEETRLAIENLSPFIPAYGRHAIIQRLLEKYQSPSTETESSVSKAYHDIAMKLYEIVEGGYYADDSYDATGFDTLDEAIEELRYITE